MISMLGWIPVLSAAGLIAWLISAFASPAWLESWLTASLLWTSFGVGALGLLMAGHLFNEHWLAPVRAELESAARTLLVSTVLFVPVLVQLAELYPWASPQANVELTDPQRFYLDPEFFRLRVGGYLVAWVLLAVWIARVGHHRFASAFGLLVLFSTFVFADLDLIRSRELAWWAQLEGVSFGLALLLGTLAVAMVATLLEGTSADSDRLRALTRTLLLLAFLSLWLWSTQYLIVWSANLPEEIAWYQARTEWGEPLLGVPPGRLVTGAIVLALTAGAILAALPHRTRGRLMLAAALLLAQHVGQIFWMLRPSAMVRPSIVQDAVAIISIGALWLAAYVITFRQQLARERAGALQEVAR